MPALVRIAGIPDDGLVSHDALHGVKAALMRRERLQVQLTSRLKSREIQDCTSRDSQQ